MRILFFWFCMFALLIIHTIDMELTSRYVEDNWQVESFPIMRALIRDMGINVAIWIAKLSMFSYFFLSYYMRLSKVWLIQLALFAVLYYTSMVNWLFVLGIFKWPFP
jgi:hypothetical protein